MASLPGTEHTVPSFKFLDLATELQELIFVKYYEGTVLIVSSHGSQVIVKGMPSLAVERTCKVLRERSLAVRGKILSARLVAEIDASLTDSLNRLCSAPTLEWLRQNITLLRFTHGIDRLQFSEDWKLLIEAFKNLKCIESNITAEKKCPAVTTRPYKPLTIEANRCRLIDDVLQNDWDPLQTTGMITRLFGSIEVARDEARDYLSKDSGDNDRLEAIARLDISSVLTTIAIDDQGTHFYHAVRISGSLLRCVTRS